MPIPVTVFMMFLALIAAVYSIDKALKKNRVYDARGQQVAKWLAIAYLPVIFWLMISITLLRPLLNEGPWIVMTVVIGVTWAAGVFVSFRKNYPL